MHTNKAKINRKPPKIKNPQHFSGYVPAQTYLEALRCDSMPSDSLARLMHPVMAEAVNTVDVLWTSLPATESSSSSATMLS